MNAEARPGSTVVLARGDGPIKRLFDGARSLCSLMWEGGA